MYKHIGLKELASFTRIISSWPENTAAHQRARLFEVLKVHGSVTTLEAMRFLDIVDPRARIVEIRKEGYTIKTSWVRQPSECGRMHCVGMYTFGANTEGVMLAKQPATSLDNSYRQLMLTF